MLITFYSHCLKVCKVVRKSKHEMPDNQNKGIGSAILKQLVKKRQEADLKRVWLFAAPGKAGFYEKHGFSVLPGEAPAMQLGKFEYEN